MKNNEGYIYDIVIVAGQSNAEGHGVGETDIKVNVDKTYQLVDVNPARAYYDPNDNSKTITEVTLPVVCRLEQAREHIEDGQLVGDLALTFATNYQNKYLPSNRKLLLVRSSLGGTGFTREQWGVGNVLYSRLVQMTNYALSLNPQNRIVAFLWHQGEHDAFENPHSSASERYNFYKAKFVSQMQEYRSRYKQFAFPIITGEFVNNWADENKVACDAVEKAIADGCKQLGFATTVSSEGLLSNDQKTHNGDTIHFCRDSVYKLGNMYFNAYEYLIKQQF